MTTEDLQLWQNETENFLFANPQLREAMMDPRRLFNQDETAIEVSKTIAFCLCFLPFFRNFIGNFTTFRLAQVHKDSWQMCRPRSSSVSPAQAENILLHPFCVQQTILSSLHAVFTRVSGMLHSLI